MRADWATPLHQTTAELLNDIADRLEAAHFELGDLLAEIEQLLADTTEAKTAAVWLTNMRCAAGTFDSEARVMSPSTFAATIAALRARANAAVDQGGNG